MIVHTYFLIVAIERTVKFNQSTYIFDENDEQIKLPLVLSDPSSIEITVKVQVRVNTFTSGKS